MATWKKILRENYAVGSADSLLTLNTVTGTDGDNGNFVIRLSDNRASAADGAGNEDISISLGAGLTAAAGSISLTNKHIGFIATTGAADIDLGNDLTVVGSGGISTSISDSTLTISLDNVVAITVAGDSGADQTIDFDDTLSILGTNGISTATSATDTVTITAADLTFAADSGSQAVTLGDTFTITGGTGIGTAVSGDEVTITLTDTVGIVLTGDSGTNQTIVHDGTINVAGGTGINTVVGATGTVTVNMANTTFTVDADSGTADPVALGETLTFVGGTGITTAVADNTITITSDAEAPQVTEATTGTYSLLMQSGLGDLDARIDTTVVTNEAYGAGPTYTPLTGTLTVANLTVNGVTTQVDTTNLNVADKIITIADGAEAAATAANSGLVVNTANSTAEPTILWTNGDKLSGWQVGKEGVEAKKDVAVMSITGSAPAPEDIVMGEGMFAYHAGIAYIAVP
jgi:hypothetical protein